MKAYTDLSVYSVLELAVPIWILSFFKNRYAFEQIDSQGHVLWSMQLTVRRYICNASNLNVFSTVYNFTLSVFGIELLSRKFSHKFFNKLQSFWRFATSVKD